MLYPACMTCVCIYIYILYVSLYTYNCIEAQFVLLLSGWVVVASSGRLHGLALTMTLRLS